MAKILIVDDEAGMRRILEMNLRRDSHVLVQAAGVADAIRLLEHEDFDVVLTDQKMPDGSGLDVLHAAQKDDPTTSIIFLTAVGTVELAVESMRQGAFDFLTKPYEPDVVKAAVKRAAERTHLLRENAVLKSTVRKLETSEYILGKSEPIRNVRILISRVAPTNSTVLIIGETGTGKELAARAIHRNSLRADKPFIAMNCAAVTETLLESELFGHERGAFTGADRSRAGLFEAAHKGTIFLDEVAEMSPAAQAKLLRVLADGEIQRVGSTTTKRVDVRVLAATHRDLRAQVEKGLFREDLYFRLAVVPIHIAPLRDRPGDIEELGEALCKAIAEEMKVPRKPISKEALAKLTMYSFPGNVRELRNLLERALILGQSAQLEPDDFPIHAPVSVKSVTGEALLTEALLAQMPQHLDLRDTMTAIERALIVRALAYSKGVQAEAARCLGLSRSDLGYKVSKYGVSESGQSGTRSTLT